MKYKLRMTPDQVIDNAVTAVKHLRSLGCNDIEFSPEDAGGCLRAFEPTLCPLRCLDAFRQQRSS